jgi:hypothetical protein
MHGHSEKLLADIQCWLVATIVNINYRSILGKHPLPGMHHVCTAFQGVNIIAASIQTYGSYIAGRRPSRPWKTRELCLCTHHGYYPGHYTVIRLNNESGENIIL